MLQLFPAKSIEPRLIKVVFHREVRFTIPADEKPTSETIEKQEEWLILVHLAFSQFQEFRAIWGHFCHYPLPANHHISKLDKLFH
jgi:hypothetical protein